VIPVTIIINVSLIVSEQETQETQSDSEHLQKQQQLNNDTIVTLLEQSELLHNNFGKEMSDWSLNERYYVTFACMSLQIRLSVCRLLVHPTQRVDLFGNILHRSGCHTDILFILV